MRVFPVAMLTLAILLEGCAAPVVAAGDNANRLSAAERRSADAMADDGDIEAAANRRITERYKEGARVSVSAFNGFVLLTGEVRNETMRMDIERSAGSLPGVKGIANELVVGSRGVRADDTALADGVRARLAASPALKAGHVMVVTEGGVVFLMGLVNHAEADAASEIASTTRGVQRVVRVFEYLD